MTKSRFRTAAGDIHTPQHTSPKISPARTSLPQPALRQTHLPSLLARCTKRTFSTGASDKLSITGPLHADSASLISTTTGSFDYPTLHPTYTHDGNVSQEPAPADSLKHQCLYTLPGKQLLQCGFIHITFSLSLSSRWYSSSDAVQ